MEVTRVQWNRLSIYSTVHGAVQGNLFCLHITQCTVAVVGRLSGL